ncbi:MAG: monovalent cation/H(+) antiporter subunit G [Acidobacteriota bacterium]
MILDVLSWLLLGGGAVVVVLAGFLIVRMPTFYTRLHAASVNETLGPAMILLGLALQTGHYANGFEVLLKLLLVLVFLLLTGPVASHALAKAAITNLVMPGQFKRMQDQASHDKAAREQATRDRLEEGRR